MESVKKITVANNQLANEYEKARKKYRKSKYAETLLIADGAEVQVRGVFDGVKALRDIVSSMSKSYALTFSLTTGQEREDIRAAINNLVSKLSGLNDVLDVLLHKKSRVPDEKSLEFVNPSGQTQNIDFSEVFGSLESLKVILRPLRQFYVDDRVKELEEQIQGLQRRKSKIESEIESLEEISEHSAAVQERLSEQERFAQKVISNLEELEENATQRKERIEQQIAVADERINEFSAEKDRFVNARSEAEKNREAIESFFDEIDERQSQLSKQEALTKSYLKELENYELENEKHSEKARKIIKEAESALKISGEVSLGRHFSSYFDDSKRGLNWWLVGGSIFLILAISLGLWAVYGSSDKTAITEVFVRVSLIPLALLGAGFCASRYVKQKRIIEDYGHKKVLALSITSFRNQFEGTEYAEEGKVFLSRVFEQIHAHPLRDYHSPKRDKAQKKYSPSYDIARTDSEPEQGN